MHPWTQPSLSISVLCWRLVARTTDTCTWVDTGDTISWAVTVVMVTSGSPGQQDNTDMWGQILRVWTLEYVRLIVIVVVVMDTPWSSNCLVTVSCLSACPLSENSVSVHFSILHTFYPILITLMYSTHVLGKQFFQLLSRKSRNFLQQKIWYSLV